MRLRRRYNPYYRNPWSTSDVGRFNKACARSAKCRNQWKSIANSTLASTGDEGRAIRTASGVVKRRGLTRRNPYNSFGERRPSGYSASSSERIRLLHSEMQRDGLRDPRKVERIRRLCERLDWQPLECQHYRSAKRNPYHNRWQSRIRRYRPMWHRRNPWWRNPSEEDDMRLVAETLDDLTPCDKKDWGLARHNPYQPYRPRRSAMPW